MRDRVFFPLAFVLASAFIFMALQPFADRPPRGPVSGGGRNAEDVTVAGRELNRFLPGTNKGTEVVTPAGVTEPVLRITRQTGEVYEDPRTGPHLVLAEDVEFAFEARPVEIIIEARSAGDFPASQFEANYFARTEGESGWQSFELTPEFKPHAFTFKVPRRGATAGYDYLGIRPVTPDKRRTIEVRSVRFHTVGAKSAPEPEAPAKAGGG
jgi:hypothetical protein